MYHIFVSYRNNGGGGHAGRLYDELCRHYDEDTVFYDKQAIRPGNYWSGEIETALNQCKALISVIGNQWLPLLGSAGQGLTAKKDYVLREISTALDRAIPVIPVLVENTPLPEAGKLPRSIQKLSECQALRISDETWEAGIDQLLDVLGRIPGIPEPRRIGGWSVQLSCSLIPVPYRKRR